MLLASPEARDAAKISYKALDSPTRKNHPTPDVNYTEAERPCPKQDFFIRVRGPSEGLCMSIQRSRGLPGTRSKIWGLCVHVNFPSVVIILSLSFEARQDVKLSDRFMLSTWHGAQHSVMLGTYRLDEWHRVLTRTQNSSPLLHPSSERTGK